MIIGKTIGTKIYVHKNYMEYAGIYINKEILRSAYRLTEYLPHYNCIRYNKKTKELALQYSHNFDTADEPTVDETVMVKSTGEIKTTKSNPDNPQIWHHRWLWVDEYYSGFDVAKSKKRSIMYMKYITKEDKQKMGYKNYWDKIRTRWE